MIRLIKIFVKRTWFIILPFLAYVLVSLLWIDKYTNCLFKMVCGLPCPTCGMTRAFLAILTFNFETSFYYHPLWILVIVALLVLFLEPIKFVKKWFCNKYVLSLFLLTFFITYIIRMILYFPNEPLSYESRNLISILLEAI